MENYEKIVKIGKGKFKLDSDVFASRLQAMLK